MESGDGGIIEGGEGKGNGTGKGRIMTSPLNEIDLNDAFEGILTR